MQQPAPQAKVILPNIQVYGNDCWLQSVVLLCYYNNNNYNRIINYKGNIPFLIHLRNFFNEIENLKFLYENEHIQTLEEFYLQVANLMLSTTEKLKDDTVEMNKIFPNNKDWYSKNSFYSPYDCINAINTIFTEENNSTKGIIDASTLPAEAQISYDPIKSRENISLAIALNESIGQNVMFFHFPDHWTVAIRNKDGKFLYYDNMRPYKSDGKIHYFDGEQMQKYYIWDINKLLSNITPKNTIIKKNEQQITNLKNYYQNNQIKK